MAQRALTTPQKNLIQALACQTNTISDAAAMCGILPKVAMTWLQLPYMRQAFDQARKDIANKILVDLHAGRLDEAVKIVKLIHPDQADKLDKTARAAADLKDVPEVKASLQPVISYLETYRDRPFNQAIVWR